VSDIIELVRSQHMCCIKPRPKKELCTIYMQDKTKQSCYIYFMKHFKETKCLGSFGIQPMIEVTPLHCRNLNCLKKGKNAKNTKG